MNAKSFDLERLQAQLKLWDAEISHLAEKLDRLRPDPRSEMQVEGNDMLHAMLDRELATLRQLRDEAVQELQAMEQAGDDEWANQGERAERALQRLGEAFEQSRARFEE